MDFSDLNFAYEKRNWAAPSCMAEGIVSSTSSPPSSNTAIVYAHYTAVEDLPLGITSAQLFASSIYTSAKQTGLAQALQVHPSNIRFSGFQILGSSRRLSGRELSTSKMSVKTSFKIHV